MAENEAGGPSATPSLETSAALTAQRVEQVVENVAKLEAVIQAHEMDSKARIRGATISTIGIGAIGVAALIAVMIYMGNTTNANIIDVRSDNREIRAEIRNLTIAIAELKSATRN